MGLSSCISCPVWDAFPFSALALDVLHIKRKVMESKVCWDKSWLLLLLSHIGSFWCSQCIDMPLSAGTGFLMLSNIMTAIKTMPFPAVVKFTAQMYCYVHFSPTVTSIFFVRGNLLPWTGPMSIRRVIDVAVTHAHVLASLAMHVVQGLMSDAQQ